MATRPQTGLTYADLERFPDDGLRRELIGGELFVTAAPRLRHQEVVGEVFVLLRTYATEHGGRAYLAPTDVFLSDVDVVEPDVLFVSAEHLDRLEEKFVRSAPDVVVEVSSPTTRPVELTRKKDLYERYGVPEYWYLDLEVDRVEVYWMESGRYGQPTIVARGQALESAVLPGLAASVDDLFGPSGATTADS
jgi:Uma2 family endonuclease